MWQLVNFEITTLIKSQIAQTAMKYFVFSMSLLMASQTLPHIKRFVTNVATKWSLSSMYHSVVLEVFCSGKRLVTFITWEWTRSRMWFLVDLKLSWKCKSFRTFQARKRFQITVLGLIVTFQAAWFCGRVGALFAWECFDASVQQIWVMSFDIHCSLKRLSTGDARKWLLLHMNHLVALHILI